MVFISSDTPLNKGFISSDTPLSQGFVAPDTPIVSSDIAPARKFSRGEAMWHAGRIGIKDTARGIQQIAGLNEEQLAEEQRLLNDILQDPEHGNWAMGAYVAGLIADPVTWAFPIAKLKHINTAKKVFSAASLKNMAKPIGQGAAYGAGVGALGYVDPESGLNRLEQAAITGVGGAAAVPIAKGIGKVYNEKVADAAWGFLRNPAGLGSIGGGIAGYNIADDDLPIGEKLGIAFSSAALGGALFRKGKLLGKHAEKLPDKVAKNIDKFPSVVKGLDKWKVGGDVPKGFGEGTFKNVVMPDDTAYDVLRRLIIPDWNLADDWIAARSRSKGKRRLGMREFEDFLAKIAKLPASERQVLYEMRTDPKYYKKPMSPQMQQLLEDSGELIDKYGKQMVDLGILDEAIWNLNKGTYIHRTYNRPHKGRAGATPEMESARFRVIGDELIERGIAKDIPRADWEAGMYDKGTWYVTQTLDKNKVRIRRDYTPEERAEMDEVTDFMRAFDQTGKILTNDVSAFKFFQEVARNPKLASTVKTAQFSMQVPNQKAYGELAGKYINKESYRDLLSVRDIYQKDRSQFLEKYRQLNAFWKGDVTIANPAVHTNNFLSNIMHYDFKDGNWKNLAKAFGDLRSKNLDYQEAESLGVFGGFFGSELAQGSDNFYSIAAKGFKPDKATAIGAFEMSIPYTLNIAKKMKNLTWDKAVKLYGAEDQVFRMALYRTERDKLIKAGLSDVDAKNQAARTAREWFVDYERTSPVLETLRQGPLPFASYMYGIIPKLAETAAKKPIKFAKWASIFYGLDQMGKALSEDDPEDYLYQQRISGKGKFWGMAFMPYHMVKLPEAISPKTRDDWYLDAQRLYPMGDIFGSDTLPTPFQRIEGIPNWMQPSFGAGGALFDAVMDKDMGGVGDRATFLAKQFIPNWPISGIPFVDPINKTFPSYAGVKLKRALSGKYSPTRDVHTPASALLSGLGIKTTPVSTSKARKRAGYAFASQIESEEERRTKAKNDFRSGEIDREQYDIILNDVRNEIRRINAERRAFLSRQ
tara:strand:+ start:3097 stop:6213 length:3117 start_codon:yes stop_codon:yes gene_type:complete